VFDYSELNVNGIDELIVPPALLSLSLGKISSKVSFLDEKVSVSKNLNINLTAVVTAFEEEILSKFLEDIRNTIENPYNISL
jgi:pyruvate/2-oxoglutarate dehydrogenase complex dihydrolipoamide acyltransferase (E2) component